MVSAVDKPLAQNRSIFGGKYQPIGHDYGVRVCYTSYRMAGV
jgi:hypothetical protein